MKLVWTHIALEDRRAIREFIAAESPGAALELDALLFEKASVLVDFPAIGRPGRVPGTRELVVHRNYLLVYDTAGGMIRIIRVLHVARMWPPSGDET